MASQIQAQNQKPTRSVLITGASTGIGRASALDLAARGWQVFAGVRRDDDGERLRGRSHGQITPVRLDVTDAAGIEACLAQVTSRVGEAGLQGLVNNAGISCPGAVEFIELAELRHQLEVNLIGQVAVTQAFLPLVRQGRGRIVNVSSMGGFVSNAFLGAYNASKFGMEAISDSLRRELRPWKIPVSVVQPGSIDTEIWSKGDTYSQKLIAGLDGRAKALYGDAIIAMVRFIDTRAKSAIPAGVAARTIRRALTARRPRTRYR
ncbi:MAG: SDR family oxidoreductase, partial [Proteobacteria bacterium]|nr:SDR family oxidoreductase [Pseudomonadota bacterium]